VRNELRVEQLRAMTLVGLAHHYAGEMGVDSGSQQWNEFMGIADRIPGHKDEVYYGVCMNGDTKGNMDYVCAVEVAEVSGVAEELTEVHVPAGKYAVYTHHGHISGIQESWKRLFGQALPDAGLKESGDLSFERYDSRFDPATGEGDVEIWIPVA
jgi:AraC family transcriptional regulator